MLRIYEKIFKTKFSQYFQCPMMVSDIFDHVPFEKKHSPFKFSKNIECVSLILTLSSKTKVFPCVQHNKDTISAMARRIPWHVAFPSILKRSMLTFRGTVCFALLFSVCSQAMALFCGINHGETCTCRNKQAFWVNRSNNCSFLFYCCWNFF